MLMFYSFSKFGTNDPSKYSKMQQKSIINILLYDIKLMRDAVYKMVKNETNLKQIQVFCVKYNFLVVWIPFQIQQTVNSQGEFLS